MPMHKTINTLRGNGFMVTSNKKKRDIIRNVEYLNISITVLGSNFSLYITNVLKTLLIKFYLRTNLLYAILFNYYQLIIWITEDHIKNVDIVECV